MHSVDLHRLPRTYDYWVQRGNRIVDIEFIPFGASLVSSVSIYKSTAFSPSPPLSKK